MSTLPHEYTSTPRGHLTIYRCRHCGAAFATAHGPPDRPCPERNKKTADETVPAGVGTELKRMLGWFGIEATANCSCRKKAKIMDERGLGWCWANLRTISGWLEEQARNRKLRYSHLAGKTLIIAAICMAWGREKWAINRVRRYSTWPHPNPAQEAS